MKKELDKKKIIIIISIIVVVLTVFLTIILVNKNSKDKLKEVNKVERKKIKDLNKVKEKEEEKKETNNDVVKTEDEETLINNYEESESKSSDEVKTEDDLVNYISNYEVVTNNYINAETSAENKSKLKQIFITLTDFIFYNGTIKGKTFNELSDASKQKVMTTWENIDSKINNKYPNYKETISENGSKVYSGIKDKASELKNIIVMENYHLKENI